VQDHAVAPQRLLPADAHARAEFRVGFDGGANAVPYGDRKRRAVPRSGNQAMSRPFLFLGVLFILAAFADPNVQEVLQRDVHARGQATMDRVVQDGVQRVCTESRDKPPAELAKWLEAAQMKTIAFPDGRLIGES